MDIKKFVLAFFVSFSIVNCFAVEPTITEVKFEGPWEKMQKGEKFYLVYKGTLLLDVDNFHLEEYEKRVGQLKKEDKNPIRTLNIEKLPELGAHPGDKIHYFNSVTSKIEEYVLHSKVRISLIPSPYDPQDGYYIGFNLLMNPSDKRIFDWNDHQKFDGFGYMGTRLKLKPIFVERGEVSRSESETNPEIIKIFNGIKGIKKDSKVQKILRDDKKIFFAENEYGSREFLLETAPNRYAHWSTAAAEKSALEVEGDFFEGAAYTLIYRSGVDYILILIFKDKIERYKIFQGSMA